MISARWSEVKQKLQDALDMGAPARSVYLAKLEAEDPEMHREIQSLLNSHEQAGDTFLNAPERDSAGADPTSHSPTMIGRRIGSYRIVEWIGAGGMGEVYRAARADDQFEKQVALKLVRTGPDSAFVISRFKNERQILAQLDHANIARLLDGGTTDDGVPYFVMELVEGLPIDEYCDAYALTIPERLSLFRQVCSAVQYAHQLLIIHRDIKPGNILVTAEGVPKLLDFGIAKILSEEAEGAAPDVTLTAFAALTPGYASPEQVMGQPITTASDVYSLGVVLYELLTGRRPYRITGRSPQEIAHAVCEVEPERPSTAVVRQIQTDGMNTIASAPPRLKAADDSVAKISKRLAGDLDNIVLMALRKEPMRRYSTVEQFSQDIQRHLEHLPVHARRATLAYSSAKFVARYRTGVAAAVLATLSLVTGLVVSLREARIARVERARAERRFNDVRSLSNTLLFKIDDSIKDLPGSTEAQHLLISSAQQYLDSLYQEASGDVSLLEELAEGYQRLGLIQGSNRDPNLGDAAAAIVSLRKAVALREAMVRAAPPSDRDARHELQKAYEALAEPLLTVNVDEAAAYIEKSTKLAEDLYREEPSNTELLHSLALAYQDQAQVLTYRDDLAGATTVQGRSLDLAKQLAEKAPNPVSLTLVSYEHKRLGGLMISQKKYVQALDEYTAAQKLDESLLAAHPDNRRALYAMTFNLSDIGYIYWKQGNYGPALANYQKVLGVRESFAAADPHDARAIGGVARTCGYIGDVLRDEKKPEQALHYDQRRLSILESQSARAANDRQIRAEIAEARWDIGDDYLAIAGTQRNKSERAHNGQLAQQNLLQAQSGIAEAKEHGLLYGDLLKAPQEIERDLAKCNELLHAPPPGVKTSSATAKNP